MLKALVISAFILSIAANTNYGYELLLARLDELVASSYGSLATNSDAQLNHAGREVSEGYSTYRKLNR